MRFADSQPKRIRMCGDQDEMNVVGHQAIRPHLNLVLGRLLTEQVKVDGVIPVLEEDRLAPVTAPG